MKTEDCGQTLSPCPWPAPRFPAALELHSHALTPVADLPVRKVRSALHFVVDLTLQLGEVVHGHLPARR